MSSDREAVSRETLYKEVWEEPMTSVALRYDVSSSFLARVCTRLNVPRPPRGYWAKLAAGQKLRKPPLPNPLPGVELEWCRDGQPRRAPMKVSSPERGKNIKRKKRTDPPDRHPILNDIRQHLKDGRISDTGLIKPKKYLLPDIVVSKGTTDRALDVANEFFLLLEQRGHTVKFAPHGQQLCRCRFDEREKGGPERHYPDVWRPSRPVVVFIGSVAIGLTLFEMTENVEVRYMDGEYIRTTEITPQKLRRYTGYSWTTTKELASGRLCLLAFSPYRLASWRREWREKKQGDLTKQLLEIAKELEKETVTIARLIDEGERRAEIERQEREIRHQEWLRERAEEQRRQARKDSREELLKSISAWAEIKRINDFFQDVERQALELADDEKDKILVRLKLARELIGAPDSLTRFLAWKAPEER